MPKYNNVAFIVPPSQELERPPASAAALGGIMSSMNINYKIYDLNLSIYESLSTEDWNFCEKRWRIDSNQKLPIYFYQWLDSQIEKIKEQNTDLIAVSVLGKFCTQFTKIFLEKIRLVCDTPIIIGGQGLTTPWGEFTFGDLVFKNKLVDYICHKDGEILFKRFLNGETNIPGLNYAPPEEIVDLENLPYPNLDHIEPKKYYPHMGSSVYITASRGCVRKCQFCDVPHRWKKYRYRSGVNIAREMYHQFLTHGVSVFQFTDSVINGVIPVFENLQEQLIELKKNDLNFKPKWLSQFNIRKKKVMPERIYHKMSDAGASVLICGVEHASWKIRESMGKEFDDEDLDHHIRMCAKYGISNVFLMFIGYPTETIEDHQKQLKWLETYKKYVLSGTIMVIRWGYTGSLDYGSRLDLKKDSLNIIPEWENLINLKKENHFQDWLYGRNWINLDNPDLTFRERIRRRLEVYERSIELGWPNTRSEEELKAIKIICQHYLQPEKNIEIIEEPGDH